MHALRLPTYLGAATLAGLLAFAPAARTGPGLINTDYPSVGWYVFHGPILQPRFGIPPVYALTQLEYQHFGIGYGGWGYGFSPTPWGYWPYPYGAYNGLPLRRHPRPLPLPALLPPLPPDSHAEFAVNVPCDAEVWLDGIAMHQTGTFRRFISPPLQPGASYSYTVRARWTEGDRVMDQSRDLTVQPGAAVSLTFPLLQPAD